MATPPRFRDQPRGGLINWNLLPMDAIFGARVYDIEITNVVYSCHITDLDVQVVALNVPNSACSCCAQIIRQSTQQCHRDHL